MLKDILLNLGGILIIFSIFSVIFYLLISWIPFEKESVDVKKQNEKVCKVEKEPKEILTNKMSIKEKIGYSVVCFVIIVNLFILPFIERRGEWRTVDYVYEGIDYEKLGKNWKERVFFPDNSPITKEEIKDKIFNAFMNLFFWLIIVMMIINACAEIPEKELIWGLIIIGSIIIGIVLIVRFTTNV